jgi:hypothetical protein
MIVPRSYLFVPGDSERKMAKAGGRLRTPSCWTSRIRWTPSASPRHARSCANTSSRTATVLNSSCGFGSSDGVGTIQIDGQMVDKPHLTQALQILAAAAAAPTASDPSNAC